MAPVIERLLPDVMVSTMRFLNTAQYQVGDAGTPGTLKVHADALADASHALKIRQGYPDDLTKIVVPTLALAGPTAIEAADEFYGSTFQGRVYRLFVYGFVTLGDKTDPEHVIYRDALMNDVLELFLTVGRSNGILMVDSVTKADLGSVEVVSASGRVVPAVAPQVPAERHKFLITVDVEITT